MTRTPVRGPSGTPSGALTDAEIRALHATPPGLPPTALGGPCHCPVCDPALHAPSPADPAA